MVIRQEIARLGDRTLIEVRAVCERGQVSSLSYEVDGAEPLLFATLGEAEKAFLGAAEVVAA